jgi:hypothetical protein
MRDELQNENKYLITKRNQISEALKETSRINEAIKKRREKVIELQKERLRQEAGRMLLSKIMIIIYIEEKLKRKIAQDRRNWELAKKEVHKKKLQELLGSDIDDIDELERMKNDMINDHLRKMKEDKADYLKALEQKPSMCFENKINVGVSTDISFDQKGNQNSVYGSSRTHRNTDEGVVSYLYGPKAFDALDQLTKEQIKEYLPLTNLD